MSRINLTLLGLVLVFSGCKQKLSDTVTNVRESVVHIEKVGEWQGSGFVMYPGDIVCTAKHVVEGGGEFVVTFDDGTKEIVKYSLVDRDHDLGFLKLSKVHPYLILQKWNLRAGDPVFIMGSPLGFGNFNSVTLGIVSAKQRNLDYLSAESKLYGWQTTFQSDSAAYPGNSGGPVFNMQGRVVGVLVAGRDASLNYSVPVEVMFDIVPKLGLKFKLMRLQEPVPIIEQPHLPMPEPPYGPEQPEYPQEPEGDCFAS